MPTAVELPRGTVRILEHSAPESLAHAIEDVLADPAQQADLAEAAMDFAGTHTVGHLASVLRKVTTTLAEP
ncbi:MAG: hypothetical protein ACLGI3_10490 [Actinomycetes bacterium]